MKKLLATLVSLLIALWWAIRLYTKRAFWMVNYGSFNYREKLHYWYFHIQQVRNEYRPV